MPRAQALRAWLDGVRALFAERSLPVDDAVVQCARRCMPTWRHRMMR